MFIQLLWNQEREAATSALEAAERERDTSRGRLKEVVGKYKALQVVSDRGKISRDHRPPHPLCPCFNFYFCQRERYVFSRFYHACRHLERGVA